MVTSSTCSIWANSRSTWLWAVLTLPVCIMLGCRPDSARQTAAKAPLGPEEKFQRVMEYFKQDIDTDEPGVATGFTTQIGVGTSRLTFETQVEDELIKPQKEGDPYRAIVTVTTTSHYAVIRPEKSEEETENQDSKEKSKHKRGLFEDESEEGLETGVFDSELISKQEDARQQGRVDSRGNVLSTQDDEDVRQYELAYENDRWVLKSTPEQASIQSAFERALRQQ